MAGKKIDIYQHNFMGQTTLIRLVRKVDSTAGCRVG